MASTRTYRSLDRTSEQRKAKLFKSVDVAVRQLSATIDGLGAVQYFEVVIEAIDITDNVVTSLTLIVVL